MHLQFTSNLLGKMGGEVGIISKLIFCIYFAINSGVIGENLSENNVSNPQEEGKLIAKRYDLDFQTCIENFDIHKDKIIRTQDSRAMGAKYINEIDVTSREDCLRLCCETSTCDVFVFEEKNPGSCYLFHCGTPDDFKCKFTKHHNYTSAVLAINRHMTELENQIKLTKHEEELTRLRKPETVAEQSTIQPYAATSLVPPGPSAKESAPLSPASSSNATAGRRCSRYQFECHSSGECIAIYNACDGIPQCADGSDEALELDCPDLGTTSPPAPPIPTLSAANVNKEPGGLLQSQHSSQQQQLPSQLLNPAINQQVPDYNMASQTYRQQQQGWPQVQQQVQQPQQYGGTQSNNNGMNLNNNQKMFSMNSNMQQQQPQQQVQGNKLYGREGEGANFVGNGNNNLQWQNYPQQQQQQPPQPQMPPAAAAYQGPMNQFQGGNSREYEEQGSHIFNHKSNGLVADSDSTATQYGELPHNDYKYGNNGPNNYYNNGPYRQPSSNWQPPHQQHVQDMNPMGALDDVSPHMADNERNVKMGSDGMRGGYNSQPIPPDYYYEDSQEGRFHAPQHPHDSESSHHHQQAGHAAHPAQGEQESIADGASPIKMKDLQNSKHKFSTSLEAKLEADISTSPKRKTSGDVNEDSHGNVTVTTTPDTEATNSLHGHNSHLKKTHKEDLEEANFSEMIEEEPGRPSGAILSLALGLCITGIMVVLIGCRLRVVRRRLRRGGKSPYAHDADYLVNGMYL